MANPETSDRRCEQPPEIAGRSQDPTVKKTASRGASDRRCEQPPEIAGRSQDPTLKSSETAERIYDAALHLFAQHGYAGVSVRDIAERAGVNKALVFYHHTNKASLLDQILQRYYQAYRAALAEALAGGGDLPERVHRLLDANLDFIEENLAYVRLVQVEVALQGELVEHIARGLQGLYRAVESLLAQHAPDAGPLAPRQLFVSFSGMVNVYFVQARALEPLWPGNPMSVANLRERRQHLHWMMDAVLERLASSRSAV